MRFILTKILKELLPHRLKPYQSYDMLVKCKLNIKLSQKTYQMTKFLQNVR